MAEVLLPTWIIPEDETQEWLDEGSSVFSSAFAPGIAQRQSYGGLRLKLSRRHTVRAEEKAQLLSILNATRGRYNAMRTKVHFALRGAGFGAEQLSNNTFANGTTGFAADNGALSVADRTLRLTASTPTANVQVRQSVTLAQYVPYVLRSMINDGAGSAGLLIGPFLGAGNNSLSAYSTSRGMRTASAVNDGTGSQTQYPGVFASSAGFIAGTYISIPWSSLSRCALVDNGPNALLQSDDIANASWGKTAATVPSAGVAPDGSASADFLREDSTTAQHFASQSPITISSAAADYSFSVAVRSSGRDFVRLALTEILGGDTVSQYYNLSTGAVGTTGATGANWANRRAFITDAGDGWYICTLVGRKTNAATSLTALIIIGSADGTDNYLGNSTDGLVLWRATLAQSSIPTRLIQTTSAASTGTAQTGNALHLKGLPASTDGLLLPGDYFEIGGEIKQATAALNSDAAGLGYLQFEPALVRSPADNDPVVITDPMGKFLVSNIKIDNQFGIQAVVTYDLEHIYE